MGTRTPQFAVIPSVPQIGIQPWQATFYNALKENVELLTGTRAGSVGPAMGVIRSDTLTVLPAPEQKMRQLSAEGSGISMNNVSVPTIADYAKLMTDVQTLANDVFTLTQTVNELIKQLKAAT